MPNYNRTVLSDLNVFLAIARRGSFAGAANELGLSTSALSHAMKKLEDQLEIRLLNRSNRSLSLTAAGQDLLGSLTQGFETIYEGLNALETYRNKPAGRLRLNIAHDAARLLIVPAFSEFTARFPDVHLDLVMDDRLVDIIAEGFDAGIRYGATVPLDMIAIALTGPQRWVVVGAPAYLEKHGRPVLPEDLQHHQCIQKRIGDHSVYPWELGSGDTMVRIEVPGPIRANTTEVCVGAALQGIGLAYCLEMRVRAEIESGALEVVMPDWASTGEPFAMYYSSRRQLPSGLRQLIEIIRQQHRT